MARHHAAAHGGSWKVAYADFVTSMMALFLVLWLISADEVTKEAIATYFRGEMKRPGGEGMMKQQKSGPAGFQETRHRSQRSHPTSGTQTNRPRAGKNPAKQRRPRAGLDPV